MTLTSHQRRDVEDAPPRGSDRSFGIVMTCAFWVFAGVAWWKNPASPWVVGLGLTGSGFLILALLQPKLLSPLNKLWMKFGELLHKIVSPIVMGSMFFLVITPIGLVMRMFGKDLLQLRRDPDRASYWIKREDSQTPSSMTQQF